MALVCLCNGVSERKVRRAIGHGACSIGQIGAACGAGTTCRGCHPTLAELLVEQVDDRPATAPASAALA